MKAYKGKKTFILFMFLVIFLPFFTKVYAEDSSKYYMIVSNLEDNNIQIELGQEQILYDNESAQISLDNLEIIPTEINFHYAFDAKDSSIDTLTAKLREYLLSIGYAKLKDSKIATKNEKKAQKYAKKYKRGIWDCKKWLQKIVAFLKAHFWQIAKPVLTNGMQRTLYFCLVHISGL